MGNAISYNIYVLNILFISQHLQRKSVFTIVIIKIKYTILVSNYFRISERTELGQTNKLTWYFIDTDQRNNLYTYLKLVENTKTLVLNSIVPTVEF